MNRNIDLRDLRAWATLLLLFGVIVGGGVLLAGCDSGAETGHDAGVAKRDDQKRHVYNMPRGVPNITAFCSFGNLVYEGSRSGSGGGFATVLADARQCKGVPDGGQPHA